MVPRQLLLELEEVDSAAEKGPKRVRADSTNEVPDYLPELRLWHGMRVQQPTGCGCTPHDYHSFCCPLHHPTGSSIS
eukprot:scaffold14476_cov120-Isochrysis_galbana.AAC.1